MSDQEWSLSSDQRKSTVARVAANISSIAFSKGQHFPDADAERAAENAERKAYTVARVEAKTTTGVRPHSETYEAYTRKLASLVLEAITTGHKQAERAGQNGIKSSTVVDLTGEREFLTKETAEVALAAMLAPGSKVSQIKFSTKSFGIEAAEVAARAIANVVSSLTHADISDIIAGRPEKEVLGALQIISQALAKAKLKALDLSDNALALQELAFQNVGCSINACTSLAELVQNAQELRSMRLYNNMSDDAGAAAIAKILSRAPKLEAFRMASSRVGLDGGVALANSMATGNCLQQLDLSDNPMTGDVAESLAEMLKGQPHLRALNLNDTSLEDAGVSTIAQALANSGMLLPAPGLEELELALNEVTPDGAKELAAALAGKSKLQKLNLRENELEDRGVILLCGPIQSLSCLRVLDLAQNQVRRAGALAVTKAVADKQQLEMLDLDVNEIPDSAIDDIKAILKKAGKASALGSLEENDPDAADDDEEEDGAEEEQTSKGNTVVDTLTDLLGKTGLTSK
ncbi:MAG: RAN GTPase-activating 2-like [Trebouxia sp. A1-2]|nr:MAG: RAN GTPase-activating 2-like [Trebouxia sp. A1-2]